MHGDADSHVELRRFEEAQRVGHVGSFEWDPRADTFVWSAELRRIYGLGDDHRIGSFESFIARVHPDDVEHTRGRIEHALRTGGAFEYDNRIVRADGAVRVLHTSGGTVHEQGRALRVLGCCWDTTETSGKVDHLRHALTLLQATLDAAADGLLVVDIDRRIAGMNRRFRELWRIPPDVASTGDDARLLSSVADQLEDPIGFFQVVEELYADPGRERLDVIRFRDGRVFERFSTLQRVGGAIVGRVWSFRDVTERAAAMARLEFMSEASRLLGSLDAEPALEAVARIAVPLVAVEAAVDLRDDGGFYRLTHVSLDPERPSCAALHDAVRAGVPLLYEENQRSCIGVPLVVQGEVAGAITFVAHDERTYSPADRGHAEELGRRAALSLENARLYRGTQEALHARERFLSIAAHEIRGPITSIRLAVQSLRRKPRDVDSSARLLAIIEREERRLARFVEELLDVTRIRSGQLGLVLDDVDLVDVVVDVAGRLRHDAERAGSVIAVDASAPVVGLWDRFRLDQIATNLLSNAIKFGQGRPVTVRIRAQNGFAHVDVEDHGIGIAPEMSERIFQPFERLVSVRHYGGLGLGLYIVRVLVDALGGDVHVQPTPGGGTTFKVALRQRPTTGS